MRVAAVVIVIVCALGGSAAQSATPVRATGTGKAQNAGRFCWPIKSGTFRIDTVGKKGTITYSDGCKPARFRSTAITYLFHMETDLVRHLRLQGTGIFNGRKVVFLVTAGDSANGGKDSFGLVLNAPKTRLPVYEANGYPPGSAITIR
jgi:hypothetical protein